MAIIAILFSAIFVASSSVLTRAKTNATQAVLRVVGDALDEFQREQQANPTITRAVHSSTQTVSQKTYGYRDRYGEYPPDELEVFTKFGLPDWKPPTGAQNFSLAPGKAVIGPSKFTPSPLWSPMRFYTDTNVDANALEHRDIAAMVLAIDLLGDTSKEILDTIPARNWNPRRSIPRERCRSSGWIGPNDLVTRPTGNGVPKMFNCVTSSTRGTRR